MAKVTIYTRQFCPYCSRALSLLKDKNADFTEIDAGKSVLMREEMVLLSGGKSTFPQIFIGNTHIGGCDDMVELDRAGKLDPMLAGA